MKHIHKAKLNSIASTKLFSKLCFKLKESATSEEKLQAEITYWSEITSPSPNTFLQTLLSIIQQNLWKSIKLVTLYHYTDSMARDCNLISGVACIYITELSWLLSFIISSHFQKGRTLSAALFSFTLIDTEFNYVFLSHST